MQPSNSTRIHLTYCLNVFPGERWIDQQQAAQDYVETLGHCGLQPPFGLGLRLSQQAVTDVQQGDGVHDFSEWCQRHNSYVFTMNGFPFGGFHRDPVKASVYRPDWTTDARRDYTRQLADVLAAWLPDDVAGSISTVPVWYKPDYSSMDQQAPAMAAAIENMILLARHFETIADQTGRDICLALEPEPWCYLETIDDTVAFFHKLFQADGGKHEAILRRRIGVCLDTCHCALAYERPAETLRVLRDEGIRIAKIQLSAALSLIPEKNWRDHLLPFTEPIYFHQTTARYTDGLRRWPDLPEAIEGLMSDPGWREVRTHYHVPLHWSGHGPLQSTRATMDEEFWQLIREGICPHVEVETYTYDVMPPGIAPNRLMDTIALELQWVRDRLVSGDSSLPGGRCFVAAAEPKKAFETGK